MLSCKMSMKSIVLLLVTLTILEVKCQGRYSLGSSVRLQTRTRPPSNMNRLQEVYNWSQMDFNFPSEQARQDAIRDGTFVQRNVSVPASVEAAGSRVFVTIPRWLNGVPATLSTVPFPSTEKSPRLTPYPSWEFNRQGNCNGLTSVYRVKVDECNRVWVLDTGVINGFETPEVICPAQVYVFDLANDQLIHRYVFPRTVINEHTLLVTIEVDYPSGTCGTPADAFIYAADSDTFALIVADMRSGRAWRIRDKTMYPATEAGTFNIVGESFELMDGVFALALSPRSSGERILFYSSMNAFYQRWVPTSIIRNESTALTSPQAFHTAPHNRSSQSGDSAINSDGVMFYGLLGEQSLACWNTRAPFTPQAIQVLAQDDRTLQFTVSVQVDTEDRLWVMSTRFQSFAIGILPAEETNFRVFMAPTNELVKGTVCETSQGLTGGPYTAQTNASNTPRPSTNTNTSRPLVPVNTRPASNGSTPRPPANTSTPRPPANTSTQRPSRRPGYGSSRPSGTSYIPNQG